MINLQLFAWYPLNPKNRQMQTDAKGVVVIMPYVKSFSIAAASAVALSGFGVHASIPITASAQSIIAAITNPAAARNITATGSQAGALEVITITGTNMNGDVITETLTLNGTAVVQGNKAFKTVTSIGIPVQTQASDAVTIGWGNKLGLPFKMSRNLILFTFLGGVKEAIAPTLTISATVLESNTLTLNSVLNGTQVEMYSL